MPGVENNLSVLPADKFTDEAITTNVKAVFERDETIDKEKIDVKVEDSVVTLSGAVDTHTEKIEASSVPMNIPGVIEVVHNINLEVI